VYEILVVSDVIREAIRVGKNDTEILALAHGDHFVSLADDARAKVLLGMTTTEECQKNGLL